MPGGRLPQPSAASAAAHGDLEPALPQKPSSPPRPLPRGVRRPHLEPPPLRACQVLQPRGRLLLQGPRGLCAAQLTLRLAPACGASGAARLAPKVCGAASRGRPLPLHRLGN